MSGLGSKCEGLRFIADVLSQYSENIPDAASKSNFAGWAF